MSQLMTPTKIPNFNSLSVNNLREHCTEIPLEAIGTKADLISRLMDYYKVRAEKKLRDLLQTIEYAKDGPNGKKLRQEIANMIEMIISTSNQKAEAIEIERKKKDTVMKLFNVAKGGMANHGMDLDDTERNESHKEDMINSMYEAVRSMEYNGLDSGGLGGKIEQHIDFALSLEADAVVRKYVDDELAEYAEADAERLESGEFKESGTFDELSRFHYRVHMREYRAAEAKDREQKVTADSRYEADIVDELAVRDSQLEAELEADLEAAFDQAEKTQQMANHVEIVASKTIQKNLGVYDEDDDAYIPVEEVVEEDDDDDDPEYVDTPSKQKKKGTRGRAVPRKKAAPKKAKARGKKK